MDIYLIRHGQKTDDTKNHAHLGLTEKGYRQAGLTGRRLKGFGIEAVFCSGMLRAVQTADSINKYLNVPVTYDPRLSEIDMGECSGDRDWDYITSTYPDFVSAFTLHEEDVAYPKGESGADVWARASAALAGITGCGLNKVAVITHGGTIRVLVCGMLGIPQQKRFFLGRPLNNCSITHIVYDGAKGRYFIQTFNDGAHLEGLD